MKEVKDRRKTLLLLYAPSNKSLRIISSNTKNPERELRTCVASKRNGPGLGINKVDCTAVPVHRNGGSRSTGVKVGFSSVVDMGQSQPSRF